MPTLMGCPFGTIRIEPISQFNLLHLGWGRAIKNTWEAQDTVATERLERPLGCFPPEPDDHLRPCAPAMCVPVAAVSAQASRSQNKCAFPRNHRLWPADISPAPAWRSYGYLPHICLW